MLAKLKSRAVVIGLVCLAVGGARAEPTDNWVQEYVVQILWGPERNLGGSGVYLGKGLVITAAHVVGPQSRTVGIDGVSLAARLIKGGGDPDLSLLSMDERTLPTSLLERRMPLCQEQPPVGAPVILGAVRGITRTSIASPMLIPPEMRTRFSTLISEAETNGKSGSGVFDAEKKCLLGILSAKIRNNIENKDIASYFVPASAIQSFVPPGTAGEQHYKHGLFSKRVGTPPFLIVGAPGEAIAPAFTERASTLAA